VWTRTELEHSPAGLGKRDVGSDARGRKARRGSAPRLLRSATGDGEEERSMSGSVEREAWIGRVLGVTVPRQGGGEGTKTPPPEPFQIFVKSVDNVTLTLRLPNGPATTLGDLRGLVEGRTGLSLDEHMLMIGTKPFNGSHANLPVSEYGVQREQTLFLQGALKGGYGERAAMADTIMRGIVHGNVLGDIEESGGESKAKVGFGRSLLDPREKIGQQFSAALFKKLQAGKLLPGGVTSEKELRRWIAANKTFVSAATATHMQAGNCNEYANVAYTSLVSNTKGQVIYRASMTDGYDHAFVITCPTDHGKDVKALYDDPEAMVVDPWWASTICTFKDFADGHNPYDEAVRPLTKLVIRRSANANATPPLSKEFETALGEVIDGFVKGYQPLLANRAKSNKEKAERIADAGERVEQCESRVEGIKETLAKLPKDPKDDTKEQKLEREQAEQELADAEQELEEAEEELEEAREALRGVFGSPGDVWNRTDIKDDRTREDLFGTLDRALERGGIKQLEAEMEWVADDDFLNFFARDAQTMHAVLGSDALGKRFQQHAGRLRDQYFLEVCTAMTLGEFSKYIAKDDKLGERYQNLLESQDDKEQDALPGDGTTEPTGTEAVALTEDGEWEDEAEDVNV
jgi:hypothetical protein